MLKRNKSDTPNARTGGTYRCVRLGLTQTLLCGDLEDPAATRRLEEALPRSVRLVYSDPPWNPGNATYWRTHAGETPCRSYDRFLDAWCGAAALCVSRGAADVLTEQSCDERHHGMLLSAAGRTAGWTLPLLGRWTVYYGSPGSASVRRPNLLLHFGTVPLRTDPSGMAGEPMTVRACAGVPDAPPGSCVVDPCVGKGMTSRMAHYFGWDCVGIELNPKRLSVTLAWLARQGYTIEEV